MAHEGELQRQVVRLEREVADLKRQVAELEVQHEQTMKGYETDMSVRNARITQLEEEKTALKGELRAFGYIGEQIRMITADKAKWEVEALKVRDKYEAREQALKTELRLRSVAKLNSGCDCPIGVCLQGHSTALHGACWLAWAEGYILKRRGEITIDELKTQACHPGRVAAAHRQRAEEERDRITGSTGSPIEVRQEGTDAPNPDVPRIGGGQTDEPV